MALEKGGIPLDDRRAIIGPAAFDEQSSSGKCNKHPGLLQPPLMDDETPVGADRQGGDGNWNQCLELTPLP
ncbi:hypothetical protein PAMP_003978 [Pampus punctatissimus]